MGSYQIPDVDFGGGFFVNPLPTFSPIQATFPEDLTREDSCTSSGEDEDVRIEDEKDVLPIQNQDAATERQNRPSDNPLPTAPPAAVPDEEEDEEYQRAIELSRETAKEEEQRRDERRRQRQAYQTARRDSTRKPGESLVPAPLRYNQAPTQTPVQPQLSTTQISEEPKTPPIVSPLSTASASPLNQALNQPRRSISTVSRTSSTRNGRRMRADSGSAPPVSLAQRPPSQLIVPDTGRERRPSESGGRQNIRDASRSRNGSVSASSARAASGEMCDQCDTVGPERSYCNVCNCVFCNACWQMQAPHKKSKQTAGALPHEKTDHNVAIKVKDILTPDLDENAREKLHTEDIDTTWFGVVREDHELPLFRDYGRYATLMTGIKDLRLDLVETLSVTSDMNETLFPSLISFVGQTGAGKSTLIKLLVDLKSEPNEKFPTPVVGGAGRDVSTSEDVHLYLDPDSAMAAGSQAPLLFADCEGLEGGERDPIGAKLKKKLERASGTGHRKQRLRHTSERELTWANTDKKRSRDFAVAHLYPRLLYTFSDVIVFVLKNPR